MTVLDDPRTMNISEKVSELADKAKSFTTPGLNMSGLLSLRMRALAHTLVRSLACADKHTHTRYREQTQESIGAVAATHFVSSSSSSHTHVSEQG